jgi:hypothetical protein
MMRKWQMGLAALAGYKYTHASLVFLKVKSLTRRVLSVVISAQAQRRNPSANKHTAINLPSTLGP